MKVIINNLTFFQVLSGNAIHTLFKGRKHNCRRLLEPAHILFSLNMVVMYKVS